MKTPIVQNEPNKQNTIATKQWTAEELITFEDEIAAEFETGKILGPIHLSGGNEDQLIKIFRGIGREDWVFSTYRNHYHALLHGIPREYVLEEIRAGRNMNLSSAAHRFFTSAIVGGTLSIATGVAYALKKSNSPQRVFCFVGDMAASTGDFLEAQTYASRNDLPISFIIEDNGFSANSPTDKIWGEKSATAPNTMRYRYARTVPHAGIGKWVNFS